MVEIAQETLDSAMRGWHEGHIRCLVALGILKLDDLKPAEEYEQAIKAREIIEGLEIISHENTGMRRQELWKYKSTQD